MTAITSPAVPPRALSAATRFGCHLNFVRLHWGPHSCLDGRRYEHSCLITDPALEGRALALMATMTPLAGAA